MRLKGDGDASNERGLEAHSDVHVLGSVSAPVKIVEFSDFQ